MTGVAVTRLHGPAVGPAAGLPATAAAAAVAVACGAGAAALALQHPMSPTLAAAACMLLAGVCMAWPLAWLILVPALLPLAGLAPWTGWITFEEFDLLLLACAAGAWARAAADALRPAPPSPPAHGAWAAWLVWAALVALATWRGVQDAGGWQFAWFDAYRSPMNALRLAKPTLALLLLLPLWQRCQARAGAQAGRCLALGLVLGLGVVAVVGLWERLSYLSLLDFSSDYRITGPFWEMHVGGAALDGALALGLPFLVWWLRHGRNPVAWMLSAALLLLVAYAALTSFSRILLLALPAGALLALWLPVGRAGGPTGAAPPLWQRLLWLPLLAAMVAGQAWMFPFSGYRGLLALLLCCAAWLVLVPQLATLGRRSWALAAAFSLPACLLLAALAWALPKGPYVAQALLALASLGLALVAAGRPAWLAAALAAGWAALAGMVLVAGHWGEAKALPSATTVALALALGLPLLAGLQGRQRPQRPVWPADLRWQGGALMLLAATTALVAVLGGGAFLGGRLANLGADSDERNAHWLSALTRLHDADSQLWGRGLGRYLDWYSTDTRMPHRAGDIRLAQQQGQPVLRLIGGHAENQGWGELLRLAQRIPRPVGETTLTLTLRNPAPAVLLAEVCLKHLIYRSGCQESQFKVPATDAGVPLVLRVPMQGGPLPQDDHPLLWRQTVFSLSSFTTSHPVELLALSLTDAQGRELLVNPRFEQGMQRWFFTSDHHHLPWHAKNILVHLLFEQGIAGTAMLLVITLAALWRLTAGVVRRHTLAAPLAGALLGFWLVGMVDSLLDMPRVATLALLLTGVALTLHAGPAAPGSAPAQPSDDPSG